MRRRTREPFTGGATHCKRNPKVRDHGLALVEKNVLGLPVAVDQPLGVRVLER